eukprot:Partr_v1_DN28253_c1_g1_i2_m76049 putative General transcription factor IIIC, polypeptide 3
MQDIESLDPISFSAFESFNIAPARSSSDPVDDDDFEQVDNDEDNNIKNSNDSDNRMLKYWQKAARSASAADLHTQDVFHHAPVFSDDEDFENDDDILAADPKLQSEFDEHLRQGFRPAKRKGQRGPPKGSRRSKKLEIESQRDMGLANNAFLDGDYEAAVELLQNIIRRDPDVSEAYQTLAMVYEEMGESDKSLLFYMCAAHLRPGDVELWRRNAEISHQHQLSEQAAYCYAKAINLEPSDKSLSEARAAILLDMGQVSKAIRVLLRCFVFQRGDVDLAQDIAKLYLEMNAAPKALMVYQNSLRFRGFLEEKTFADMPLDNLNVYCELLILNRDFATATKILKIVLDAKQDLPIDLRVKLAVGLIHLNCAVDATSSLEVLFQIALSEVPDLYNEVAVAYHESSHWQDALNLLRLIHNEIAQFQEPATWMRIADCYHQTGDFDRGCEFYQKFLGVFPHCIDVRFAYARCLEASGRFQQGADVRAAASSVSHVYNEMSLEIEKAVESLKARYYRDRKTIYAEMLDLCEYTGNSQITFDQASHAVTELKSLVVEFESSPCFFPKKKRRGRIADPTAKAAKKLRNSNKRAPSLPTDIVESETEAESDTDNQSDAVSVDGDAERSSTQNLGLSYAEWFNVVMWYSRMSILYAKSMTFVIDSGTVTTSTACGDVDAVVEEAAYYLEKLSQVTYFMARSRFRDDYKMFAMAVAIECREYDQVFNQFRMLHLRHPESPWMLSASVQLFAEASDNIEFLTVPASQKFYTRALRRSQNKDPYILTTLGYILMLNRNFIMAMQFLARAFHFLPNESVLALSLGVAQLQRSMQRKTANRNADVICAFAFLEKYKTLRMQDSDNKQALKQEIHYNLGRAFHFIGASNLAIEQYERALEVKVENQELDIKRECAYNLFNIYRYNGSMQLAKQTLIKHLTII